MCHTVSRKFSDRTHTHMCAHTPSPACVGGTLGKRAGVPGVTGVLLEAVEQRGGIGGNGLG